MPPTGGYRRFLWGGPPPEPNLDEFKPAEYAWWNQYSPKLEKLSGYARRELTRSSRDIVSLLPRAINWGPPRIHRGLVVGAVQSGKTGSMEGVAATALDSGYKLVVVLAGTKDDLRIQTAKRFASDLLSPAATAKEDETRTAFTLPVDVDASEFRLLLIKANAAAEKGLPCIFIVKKHTASLAPLRATLQHLWRKHGVEKLPTLILDDEADEASVGEGEDEEAATPEAIANLWRFPDMTPCVAYVGYTATAAANLLQDQTNALFPADFVYLLRYPSRQESPIEYLEPDPERRYTGGESFYELFGDDPDENGNFLASVTIEDEEQSMPLDQAASFRDALRAYLVAGACRLAENPSWSFAGPIKPEPHSMLIHTSATTAAHVGIAKALMEMFGGALQPDKSITFDPAKLEELLAKEAPLWEAWHERYERSRERAFRILGSARAPSPLPWALVKAKFPEVFANVRARVINSDKTYGSTLDYSRKPNPNKAQDVFVIAIGGSKLSRGITLEGLCISYFGRWSQSPREDTVQQMSRWFGYRNRHLAYCRLFTTAETYEALREIHENDTDLRYQLAELMASHIVPSDAAFALRANPKGLPTGKVSKATVYDIAFSPHAAVLAHAEVASQSLANAAWASSLVKQLRDGPCETVTVDGNASAILVRGLPATEVAAILDAGSFSYHNPDPASKPLREHYRARDASRSAVAGIPFRHDPYQLAAYLRYWTDEGNAPSFNLAIMIGNAKADPAPFDFPLFKGDIRPIENAYKLVGGCLNNWKESAYIDGLHPALRIPGKQGRKAGAPGILAVYIIHKKEKGKGSKGVERSEHTPLLAISIPEGGPRFKYVMTGGSA